MGHALQETVSGVALDSTAADDAIVRKFTSKQMGDACEMLIAAAAAQWNVAPETLQARNGEVLDPASRRTAKYGTLLEAAAKITPPASPKLKDPKDFRYIGKNIKSPNR